MADILLGVVAFLMADDHDPFATNLGKTADERAVIAEAAVSTHFHEVAGDELEVVEGVRPGRMAHDLDALPRSEVGVDFLLQPLEAQFERLDFGDGIDAVFLHASLERLDAFFEFDDRFFKLEWSQFHLRAWVEGKKTYCAA